MEAALSGIAHLRTRVPENIIRLRVNRQTGLPTNEEDPDSYLEFFLAGTQPTTPHAQSAEGLIEGSILGPDYQLKAGSRQCNGFFFVVFWRSWFLLRSLGFLANSFRTEGTVSGTSHRPPR